MVAAEGKLARTWERAFKQRGKTRNCRARKKVNTMVTKDWRHRAACRNADPEIFFPLGDVFTTAEAGQLQQAKAICRRCPVKAECLSWACSTGLTSGIAGGTTEDERRAVRRLAS